MLSLPHKLRNHASCRLRPSERIENGCDLGLGRVIQHFSIKTGSPRMQMTKMGVKFWYPEAVQTTFGPEQYHRPSGSQKRRNRQGANLKAPPPIDASAAARGDATTTTYPQSRRRLLAWSVVGRRGGRGRRSLFLPFHFFPSSLSFCYRSFLLVGSCCTTLSVVGFLQGFDCWSRWTKKTKKMPVSWIFSKCRWTKKTLEVVYKARNMTSEVCMYYAEESSGEAS